MEENRSRAEAERLLGISEKLLAKRDLRGSREFAVLAQETEPLLEGSDQILAVVDVLLATENTTQQQHDLYAILQLQNRPTSDLDLIKRHYRRLALLLHPDKNRFPFADHAFRLVSHAWSLLSDPSQKPLYDSTLPLFSKVDLPLPRPSLPRSFWTVCPYCFVLFEYPRAYLDCCFKCHKCGRAFQAVELKDPPPAVAVGGQEGYYCCWAVFPMGFAVGGLDADKAPEFPNWMPPVFDSAAKKAEEAPRKRGRPRLR